MTPYLVIGIIILVLLIAFAVFAVSRARDLVAQDEEMIEDELGEFEQMHEEGKISDEEYRRLKRIVAEQIVEKAKNE